MDNIREDKQEVSSSHKVGTDVKFTRSMEHVLLMLFLLCVIMNRWSGTGFVKQLISLTNRTPKTIGVTLQKLADIDILKYSKQGRDRKLSVNFSNENVQSLLIELFSCLEKDFSKIRGYSSFSCNGFFPAYLNFEQFTTKLLELVSVSENEIQEHENHLKWITEQKQWAADVTDIDLDNTLELVNNSLYQFADSLLSKFKREEVKYVNGITFPIRMKLILEKLERERFQLPWSMEFDSNRNLMIDEL